ncbi:MAG: MFS transporter [Clostridia bacterium]|nr:MFS transporter [Clostridia bacterium]
MAKLNFSLKNPDDRFIFDMILLLAAELFFATGVNLYGVLFPVYMKNFVADERIISLILSIGSFMGILALVGGWLCTRFNLKWVAFCCWAVTLPAPLIFALSSSWPGFLAGQIIYNLTTAFGPAIMLYIFEHPGQGNKTGAFMLFSATTMLAGLIGPAVGGVLSDAIGMRNVLLISFTMMCIAASLILMLSPVSPKKPEASASPEAERKKSTVSFSPAGIWRFICENRRVMLWIVLLAAVMPGYNITGSILGIHVSTFGYTDTQIGLGYTISAAYGITLSLIVQRWGNRATPLFIVALLGLSCVTANVFILIPAMIGVMIPLSVGMRGTGRVVLPYLQATLTETLGVAEKGMYISSFMALRSLFAFLSTSSGGVLYKITPELPFIMEGLCGVVWVLLFAWFTKGRRPDAIDVGPVGVAAMKEKEPSISNT